MALDVFQFPNTFFSAFNPVLFKVKSDRIPHDTQVQAFNIISITESDGRALFKVQGTAPIKENDSFEILGTTKTTDYTGKIYKVIKKNKAGANTELLTNALFKGNAGQRGQIRKTGENPHLVCKIQKATKLNTFIDIGEVKVKPDLNGEFNFDLQEIIKPHIEILGLHSLETISDIFLTTCLLPNQKAPVLKNFSQTVPFKFSLASRITNQETDLEKVEFITDFFGNNITRQYKERQDLDWFSSDFNGVETQTGGNTGWLTNAFSSNAPTKQEQGGLVFHNQGDKKNTKKIGLDEHEVLELLVWWEDDGFGAQRRIATFDNKNNLINVFDSNPFNLEKYKGRIGVEAGTRQIANLLTADTKYYEIQVRRSQGTQQVTPSVRYEIDRNCTNKLRFHWLNPLGSIDSFTFKGHQEQGIEIDKTTFKSIIDFPDIRVLRNPAIKILKIESFETFTGNTGKITQFTAKWLKELFESTYVFVEEKLPADNNFKLLNYYVPVIILTDSIVFSDTINELTEISFEYRYGFNRNNFDS